MNQSFIFTDHGLKRFNQRCAEVDKELELKSLKSVKKKDVPNLSNSASYKKNKNKDKLHFFTSKNDFYFVCEEKKQKEIGRASCRERVCMFV